MPLSDKLEPREMEFFGFKCKGLFAKDDLPENFPIWVETPEDEAAYVKFAMFEVDQNTLGLTEEQQELYRRYAYMSDDDVHHVPRVPDDMPIFNLNHSCEPNLVLDGDFIIKTKVPVKKDEQVFYSYESTELECSVHYGMKCMCQKPSCRKVMNFTSWRDIKWAEEWYPYLSDIVKRKVDERNWYSEHIQLVRMPPKGIHKAFLARDPIKKGQTVMVLRGKVIEGSSQLANLPKGERRAVIQVASDLWQVLGLRVKVPESTDYIRHSCNASCGLKDSTTVIALRDLEPMQELTLDFGMLTTDVDVNGVDPLKFACSCGTPECRGTVTSSDWKLPQLQQRYMPYVPTHVWENIEKTTANGH